MGDWVGKRLRQEGPGLGLCPITEPIPKIRVVTDRV